MLLAAVCAGTLVLNQASVTAVLGYATYLGLAVLLPGTIVWNLVMSRVERAGGHDASRRSRLEDLVCGASLGYTLELGSYAVARSLDLPVAYLVVPGAVVVAWLALARPWRSRLSVRPGWGTGPSWVLGAALSYAVVWLGVRVLSAMPLRPGGVFPDVDDSFQLALVGELRHHFPGTYPYVPDEPLAYQFFYHLHAAASTWATGLSPLEVMARFDPLVFTLLAVGGAACVARRLTGRPWAGVLAAVTLTLVGSFDVSGLFRGQAGVEDRLLSNLLVHAPTQAMAFALVTPLALLALEAVRPGGRLPVSGWVTFFVLAVVMTGVKVTFVPMLLAGLAATAILLVLAGERRQARVAASATGVCLAALVVCLAVLYRGQSRGLAFDPLDVAVHYAGYYQLGTSGWFTRAYVVLSVIVGVLVPVAGLAGLLVARVRSDPRVWLLVGTGASGLAALTLLGHPGMSQRYFLYSSAWFLAVASAWGLSVLFPPGERRSDYRRNLGYAVVAGLGLFAVRLVAEPHSAVRMTAAGEVEVRSGLPGVLDVPIVLALVLCFLAVAAVRRDPARPPQFPRALVVTLVGLGLARSIAFAAGDHPAAVPPQTTVPPGGVEAAAWLRDHTGTDDVVITNAHCLPVLKAGVERCDNRHFWMSALSERRFLLEGWGYVEGDGWEQFAPYDTDPALLDSNDALFTAPSAEAASGFARLYGVRWMLADLSEGVDLEGLGATRGVQVVLVNGGFAVLAIDPG